MTAPLGEVPDLTPAAVPDRRLCSIADLTGYDLQAIRKAIGRPLISALDDNDDAAMFAWYWRASVRHDPDLAFDAVMELPFQTILDAFTTANDVVVDPTIAGNGGT